MKDILTKALEDCYKNPTLERTTSVRSKNWEQELLDIFGVEKEKHLHECILNLCNTLKEQSKVSIRN